MYCVLKGRKKVMVFDERRNRYRMFSASRWERMPIRKQMQFRVDW